MKAFILALTGLILISSSCQLTEQPKDKNTKGNGFTNNRVNEVYVNRDKNKNNFLFLSYWAGMNRAEFDIITDSLINSGYLNRDENGIFFVLSLDLNEKGNELTKFLDLPLKSCEFAVRPEYIGINLYRINLISRKFADNKTILKMYKNKYGKYREEKPELIRFTNGKPYYRYKQFIWELDDSYITITEEFGSSDLPALVIKEQGIKDVDFEDRPIILTSLIISYQTKLYKTYKSRLTEEKEKYEKNKIKEKKAIEKTKELI